ncbi:hypothetical protein [Thioalkalivibrio thiocyanodenitrificans]|uniref:hypothetical protein n=1 Tax=Thioalkalivibrio thiocyanodenitrificans TaxID=243063 RepID=UPI00036F400E|nr:hypothetical protein [Thioalkalivibrio thiocyanodenitrificans]
MSKAEKALNSRFMKSADWIIALGCLAFGAFLLLTKGVSLDGSLWVVGGSIGLFFAWYRPAPRIAGWIRSRLVGTRRSA